LEKRVRENSKDPEAWYKLGRYHDDHGQLSQAESCYRRALLVSNNTYAEAMASIGAIRLEQKKYREAEKLMRKALGIEPNNAATVTLLSMVLCYLNECDEAIDVATRATEIEPDNSHTWHQLSMAYYISGDLEEAERAARRCMSEDPMNSDHWITLGMVLQASGNFAEAEDAYKTSVRLDPLMPLGHKCLEQLYLQEGRNEDAKLAWMPDLGQYAKSLSPGERKQLMKYMEVGEDALRNSSETMYPKRG